MRRVLVATALALTISGFVLSSSASYAQTTPPAPANKDVESDLSDAELDALFDEVLRDKTLPELDKAVAQSPRDARVYLERADYFLSQKQYAKAQADYQKAATLDGKTALPHSGLAQIYRAQKNFAKALEEYEKAAALEPKSSRRRLGVAWLYAEQKKCRAGFSLVCQSDCS